ncbi:MAG TPA: protein kinase [Rhodoblastus sp.]|nr:protein kinase [Rhodoblastus sp.]
MTRKLTISLGQRSDRGLKEANQDFYGAVLPQGPALALKGVALAVADGVSSSRVSRVAAESAVKSFLSDYYCTSEAWSVKTAGQRVIAAANSWLHGQSLRAGHAHEPERGYVCAFSALILKGATAHLLHVGDARVARLAGASLDVLTEDHRVVVSADESYLARALGAARDVEIDYRAVRIAPGDIFLLTTDGVHEYLSGAEIAQILAACGDDLDAAAGALIKMALANGSRDNLTVQIARIETLGASDAADLLGRSEDLPPAPLLEPRQILDDFRIEREIHASSRSHIYLATDLATQKQVALKVPSQDLRDDPAYLRRFMMEEWTARRLDSPHVLKAWPDDRRRSALYLVSEYVEGQSLAQWMRDHPAPALAEVRDLIEQIARGLRAFHRKEILHQDLRPANVLIDRSGTAKIIDFGATRVAGVIEASPDIDAADILGTVQYSAPEYFLGLGGTTRSDLFSLAVIAYEMLTGRLPYGAGVAKARTRAQQSRLAYRPACDATRDIPAWVDWALEKALAVDPRQRQEALSEFIEDLRRPNPLFLARGGRPLIERDPALFWRIAALLFAAASGTQLLLHLAGLY